MPNTYVPANGRAMSKPIRRRMEAAIEQMIAVLDALDGDADIEPSLAGGYWSGDRGGGDDREGDHDGREPSLGATETVNQSWAWQTAPGWIIDAEQECEDEGAQCDDEGAPEYEGDYHA